MMFLETTDGVAILGYAGLGATARRTEPADWMGAVLRGRNFPLEAALAALANAMKDQLPRHLRQMPVGGTLSHQVIIPAFLGSEPQLYSIDMALTGDRNSYQFRSTRLVVENRRASVERTPHTSDSANRIWCASPSVDEGCELGTKPALQSEGF